MKKAKTDKQINQLLYDCYCELYENATPKADFKQLMESSEKVNGVIQIPFNDYSMSNKLLEEIVNKYADMIAPSWKKQMFKNTIYLGCSPKSIWD